MKNQPAHDEVVFSLALLRVHFFFFVSIAQLAECQSRIQHFVAHTCHFSHSFRAGCEAWAKSSISIQWCGGAFCAPGHFKFKLRTWKLCWKACRHGTACHDQGLHHWRSLAPGNLHFSGPVYNLVPWLKHICDWPGTGFPMALPQRVQMQYIELRMLCRSCQCNSQLSRWCAVIYYFTSKDEDNEKARGTFCLCLCCQLCRDQMVIGVIGLKTSFHWSTLV